MAITYEPIATTTLSTATATVTFSSISGSYTDLVLVANGRTSADGIYVNLRPGTIIVQIQNYSNTTTNKTMLVRGNIERPGVGGEVSAIVGMWASTAAVNRVDFITGSSTFLAGSTFTLYGIKAA